MSVCQISKDILLDLAASSHHVGVQKNRTQVIRLGYKGLYLLNHPTSLDKWFFKTHKLNLSKEHAVVSYNCQIADHEVTL